MPCAIARGYARDDDAERDDDERGGDRGRDHPGDDEACERRARRPQQRPRLTAVRAFGPRGCGKRRRAAAHRSPGRSVSTSASRSSSAAAAYQELALVRVRLAGEHGGHPRVARLHFVAQRDAACVRDAEQRLTPVVRIADANDQHLRLEPGKRARERLRLRPEPPADLARRHRLVLGQLAEHGGLVQAERAGALAACPRCERRRPAPDACCGLDQLGCCVVQDRTHMRTISQSGCRPRFPAGERAAVG